MKLESTRLDAQTLLPNASKVWRNQRDSNKSAALPDRKKTLARDRLKIWIPSHPRNRLLTEPKMHPPMALREVAGSTR